MGQGTKHTGNAAGGRASTTLSWIAEGPELRRHRIRMLLERDREKSASDSKLSASDLALAGRRASYRIRLKNHFEENGEGMRLHAAATINDGELILHLVLKGAKLNALDDDSRTPLHVAASKGCEESVEALVESGAEVDIQDIGGNVPLHAGVPSGNLKVIRSLIRRGADINASNMDGNTPLHIAALCGNHDAAEELLKHGADIRRKNARDMTPRQEASRRRHKNVDAILHLAERRTCGQAG